MFERFIQEIIDEMEKRGMIAQTKPEEKIGEKRPEPEPPAPPDNECKQFKDIWSDVVNTVETDIDAEYDASSGKYRINGKEYTENTAVWMSLEYGSEFGCNLDPDQLSGSSFSPDLIPFNSYLRHIHSKVPVEFLPPKDEFGYRQRRLLPNEADFAYAIEHCLEYDEPGFFIFCRGGEFKILTELHYFIEESDQDYLICIFNARLCKTGYRKTWCTLELEVDATSLTCAMRYVPGELIAWDGKTLATLKEEAAKGDWFFSDDDY